MATKRARDRTTSAADSMNVPVLAESARVERRRRETGRVRVAKRVSVTERVVDEPVYRDDARVERRRVDRVVTTLPRIRTEGDTTIVPVLEEVLVLEKRVVLREEIRITRVRAIGRARRRVALRTENASIERVDAAAPRKVAKRMG